MSANIMKNPDEDHLRLLSIFHYVLAAMNAFTGCIPLIHVTMGIAMLAGAFDRQNPPPPMLGLLFAGVGGTISLLFWTLATLKLLAGRWLAQHTHYRFCFVVAGIECLQMPMGTVLGVFTILVLSRESVKALFAGIPYRDPRMAALDDFHDDMESPAKPPEGPDDGSIREGRRSGESP
jgi:hypothetical protein